MSELIVVEDWGPIWDEGDPMEAARKVFQQTSKLGEPPKRGASARVDLEKRKDQPDQ